LVEELVVDEDKAALDTTWLRLILNEFDDHAIEQAILLKEQRGGKVVLLALDDESIEDVFYTASAKGADRLLKVCRNFEREPDNHSLARLLAAFIPSLDPDLVLTGVQAHNDLDGSLGPLLAENLGLPYVGYVSGVKVVNGSAVVRKEYPGGLIAEMDVQLPAVLGIQAAEKPPRYIAFNKVRQAMKTAIIEELPGARVDTTGGPMVSRMYQPEATQRAEMIPGEVEEVSVRLIGILEEIGVI
jgi:electron transfer flavoprotein beta subunit